MTENKIYFLLFIIAFWGCGSLFSSTVPEPAVTRENDNVKVKTIEEWYNELKESYPTVDIKKYRIGVTKNGSLTKSTVEYIEGLEISRDNFVQSMHAAEAFFKGKKVERVDLGNGEEDITISEILKRELAGKIGRRQYSKIIMAVNSQKIKMEETRAKEQRTITQNMTKIDVIVSSLQNKGFREINLFTLKEKITIYGPGDEELKKIKDVEQFKIILRELRAIEAVYDECNVSDKMTKNSLDALRLCGTNTKDDDGEEDATNKTQVVITRKDFIKKYPSIYTYYITHCINKTCSIDEDNTDALKILYYIHHYANDDSKHRYNNIGSNTIKCLKEAYHEKALDIKVGDPIIMVLLTLCLNKIDSKFLEKLRKALEADLDNKSVDIKKERDDLYKAMEVEDVEPIVIADALKSKGIHLLLSKDHKKIESIKYRGDDDFNKIYKFIYLSYILRKYIDRIKEEKVVKDIQTIFKILEIISITHTSAKILKTLKNRSDYDNNPYIKLIGYLKDKVFDNSVRSEVIEHLMDKSYMGFISELLEMDIIFFGVLFKNVRAGVYNAKNINTIDKELSNIAPCKKILDPILKKHKNIKTYHALLNSKDLYKGLSESKIIKLWKVISVGLIECQKKIKMTKQEIEKMVAKIEELMKQGRKLRFYGTKPIELFLRVIAEAKKYKVALDVGSTILKEVDTGLGFSDIFSIIKPGPFSFSGVSSFQDLILVNKKQKGGYGFKIIDSKKIEKLHKNGGPIYYILEKFLEIVNNQ